MNENIVMGPEGLDKKSDCAGEGQQQITALLLTKKITRTNHLVNSIEHSYLKANKCCTGQEISHIL
jgi:hypothetical protein